MTLARRIVLSMSLAAVLLFTIYVCAGPQGNESSANPQHPIAARIESKGIPNFAQVTPNLYRGAQPTQEGFAMLKKTGVGIVVDLRGGNRESERLAVTKLGMRYVSIPAQCYAPDDKTFAAFLAVLRENPDKKIFVHCRLGEDRTGMAIASYRMAEQGWTAGEAMNEMKAFGFSTTHYAMCPGLDKYEASFPERLKKNAEFQEGHAEPSAAASGQLDHGHPAAAEGTLKPSRVRVPEDIMSGLLIKKVKPAYPLEALSAGIQGRVVLKIVIDTHGSVSSVQLVSGNPALAPAAIEAVKQWKYMAYLFNGDFITAETQATVDFTLPEK